MHVRIDFTFKLVENSLFEFSQPLAPAEAPPAEVDGRVGETPETQVLPLGSSTIAPGLTMAVGI